MRSCSSLKVLGPHPATYGLGPEDTLQRGHEVAVCGCQLNIVYTHTSIYICIIYTYV